MTEEEWAKTVQWVGVVAGCLIEKDGRYLLVQEKQERAYGLWNLPAGYVDKGEALEAAAVREVKEETGYDAELVEELAIYHENSHIPVKHAFKARIIGGELKAQAEEILDVKWLTFDEIRALNEQGQIRAPWVWDVINKAHAATD